ncbi:flagellar hook-length control protein FliK [Lichenicola cladoniae]|nr:flagellar hook-length control protein FliK [Lichenicola cladoniae]
MPVGVADPGGRHDAAPKTGGAGISLTVTYVPMAASPTTPPDPVVLAEQDPGHQVADPLNPLVDAPLPARNATRLQRSSPDLDLAGEIDPLKSKPAKEALDLAGMALIAPGTPEITTMPVGSGTAPQPGSAPGPEALAQPNVTDPGGGAGAPAQVGNSLLTLATGPDGSSQMTLTLHPKELGTVHIQLDRTVNGAVRIVVTASEAGTLRSLMGDQAQLHAALDAASIPSAGRHLSFELGLAAVPAAAPGHPASPSVIERIQDTASASQTDAGTNVDMSGFQGADAQAGGGGRDPASGFSQNGRTSDTYPDAGETDPGPTGSISPGLVQRSSSRINITA